MKGKGLKSVQAKGKKAQEEDAEEEETGAMDTCCHFIEATPVLKEAFPHSRARYSSDSGSPCLTVLRELLALHKLVCFRDSKLVLNSCAWYSWKEALILPAVFDFAPFETLIALNVYYPVQPIVIGDHMKKMIAAWREDPTRQQSVCLFSFRC